MKILIATDIFFPDEAGGSARVPWELAHAFVRRGHEVMMFTRGKIDEPSQSAYDGIRVVRYPWGRQRHVWATWNMLTTARDQSFEPDVIHIHHPFSGLPFAWFPRYRTARRVYFFHSPWAEEYLIRREFHKCWGPRAFFGGFFRSRLESTAASGADVVLTLSDFMRDRFLGLYPSAGAKLARISGGVDMARYAPALSKAEARRELGWPAGKRLLFTLRNLEPRMGLDNLLTALQALASEFPQLHLMLGGTGSLRGALKKQQAELGLEEHVTFLGDVPEEDLPLAYQAADLFVLPTRALEGFGLVTVEALASGCPVVGTPVGGTPEILKPFDPSLLLEGTEARHIEDGIRRYLKHGGDDAELRKRCRAYAESRYSWDKVAADVEVAGGKTA